MVFVATALASNGCWEYVLQDFRCTLRLNCILRVIANVRYSSLSVAESIPRGDLAHKFPSKVGNMTTLSGT